MVGNKKMDSYDIILYLSYIIEELQEVNNDIKIHSYYIHNDYIVINYYINELSKKYHQEKSNTYKISVLEKTPKFIIFKRNYEINEVLDDIINYDEALTYLDKIFLKNRNNMITKEMAIEREREEITIGTKILYKNNLGVVTYQHQGSKLMRKFTILINNNTYVKYVPLYELIKKDDVIRYTKEQMEIIPKSLKELSTKSLLKLRKRYYKHRLEIPEVLRMELSTREHVITKNDKKNKKTIKHR